MLKEPTHVTEEGRKERKDKNSQVPQSEPDKGTNVMKQGSKFKFWEDFSKLNSKEKGKSCNFPVGLSQGHKLNKLQIINRDVGDQIDDDYRVKSHGDS